MGRTRIAVVSVGVKCALSDFDIVLTGRSISDCKIWRGKMLGLRNDLVEGICSTAQEFAGIAMAEDMSSVFERDIKFNLAAMAFSVISSRHGD